MIVLALLLIVAIVATVVLVSRAGHRAVTAPSAGSARSAEGPDVSMPRELAADLERWEAAGLLTAEQSEAISAYESARTERPLPPAAEREIAEEATGAPAVPGRVPVIAEALGYIGGILATIGIVLVVAQYWPDASMAARLALSGVGALVLLGAGQAIHADLDPAYARLRGFLWLASTACAALFAGVVAVDSFDAGESTPVLAASSAVVLESALLWRGRDRPLQQTAMLIALVVATALVVVEFSKNGAYIGLTLWTVGAAYLALGLRRHIREPMLTEAIGALVVVIGATFVGSEWVDGGIVFALLTAVGLLTLAAVPGLAPERGDELVLLVIGLLALGQTLPQALGYFTVERDAGFAAGMVLWLAGVGLVFVGARRLVRAPVVVEAAGAAALIGGAALTGSQYDAFAPVFGILTAVGLIILGMLPGHVLLSAFGSIGLLINVPWAIGRFFPGEARAPVLLVVAGLVILAVAVLLTRMRGRFREELTPRRHRASSDDVGQRPPAVVV